MNYFGINITITNIIQTFINPDFTEIITSFLSISSLLEKCTHLFSMSETYQSYDFDEFIHLINEIQSLKRVSHQIKFFHIDL